MKEGRVAVIGAGVCGRAAAGLLRRSGVESVQVFDKGRGGTGRCSTARSDASTFDKGATSFTLQHLDKHWWFQDAFDQGHIGKWFPRRAISSSGGKAVETHSQDPAFVPIPKMSMLGSILDPGVQESIHYDHLVRKVCRRDEQWFLETSHDNFGPFDAVLITAPAIQAVDILDRESGLRKDLEAKLQPYGEFGSSSPCKVLMLEFPKGTLNVEWDEVRTEGGWLGIGGVIIREGSKPGRTCASDAFVVQLGPARSEEEFETEESLLLEKTLKSFSLICGVDGGLPAPLSAKWFRWKYARSCVDLSQGQGFLSDATEPTLVYSGSSCSVDGLIEDTILQGYRSARELLRVLASSRHSL